MAGTTVVALRSAMKTALEAEAGLSGVPIRYGEHGTLREPEMIFFGRSSEVDQEPASMRSGRKRRDETYTFEVFVYVSSKARAEDNETRAAAIVAIIEEMLADDPKVSDVTNLLWAMPESIEFLTEETGDQPVTTATMTIRARGRLL